MQVYTARQAILNAKQNVVAYELLYRDGERNCFPDIDPHQATSQLILRTHLNTGLSAITGGKPALINFTEACILSDFPMMLPKKGVVIEILETVTPSDEVYEKCSALFHAGYTLALDDFVYKKEWNRFFKFIKLIKFDISKTPLDTLGPLISKLKTRKSLKLLAERVETKAEFNQAKEMGFHLFQGYFFCKPEMHSGKDVDSDQAMLIELYIELCKPSLNIPRITDCFRKDAGLTYKLLNYMNSGVIPASQPISSIRQALVYLGESEVRKLLTLLTTSQMAKDKPKEVFKMSAIRAKACELTAAKVSPGIKEDAFLMGLLSLIGGILDKPMAEVLEKLPVSDDIKSALLNEKEQTILRMIYRAVILREDGEWHRTTLECMKLRIDYDVFCRLFDEATVWAEDFQKHQASDNRVRAEVA